MKWDDADIFQWNLDTFPADAEKQLKKVEEELLELEAAKRQVFTSQCTNYHHIYEESADVIIACIGLKRYPEYAAIARAVYNYVATPLFRVIRPWIDQKMDENVKRKFNLKTYHHEEKEDEEN